MRDTVQLVEIGNRVKALRLVAPQQRSVQLVGAGLGHHVEHAAAGASKFDAEVAGLSGNLLNGIGDGKHLFLAADPDFVVFGSVQHVVIATRALAVDGEASPVDCPGRRATPNLAAGSFRRPGHGPSQ